MSKKPIKYAFNYVYTVYTKIRKYLVVNHKNEFHMKTFKIMNIIYII